MDAGIHCLACGAELKPGARFCKGCGKPVSPVAPAAPVEKPKPVFQAPPPPWETEEDDSKDHGFGSAQAIPRQEAPPIPPKQTTAPPITQAKGFSLKGAIGLVVAIAFGRLLAQGCGGLLSGGGPPPTQAWEVCQKYSLDKVVKELNNKYRESGEVKIPASPQKTDWDKTAKRYRFEALATLNTHQTRSTYEMPFVCTALQVDLSGAKVWKAEGVWFSPARKI